LIEHTRVGVGRQKLTGAGQWLFGKSSKPRNHPLLPQPSAVPVAYLAHAAQVNCRDGCGEGE